VRSQVFLVAALVLAVHVSPRPAIPVASGFQALGAAIKGANPKVTTSFPMGKYGNQVAVRLGTDGIE
jgi:hypothetical protein